MPYSIIKKDGKFCLQKPDKSIVKGSCHTDRSETVSMLRAIMANENKAMKEDTLIYFGDAVKALDDKGRVGGYLVLFGDRKNKDLDGEWFDADTYYGPSEGDGTECIFDHGYPVPAERFVKELSAIDKAKLQELADRTFQPLKTKRDAVGIFAETVLNLEDEYEKFIYGRIKKGKIGWSSGAPGHRVKKTEEGYISRWPIAEGSLTPRPAQPLSRAIAMKSLANIDFVSLEDEDGPQPPVKTFIQNSLSAVLSRHIEDRVDDGHDRESIIKSLARESGLEVETIEHILDDTFRASDANLKAFARVLAIDFSMLKSAMRRDYARTIKGMFEEALSDQSPSRWQLDSIYCDIIKKIATTAQASAVTGVDFDSDAKIKEATAEYLNRLQALAINQVNTFVESNTDEPFYLKTAINTAEALETDGLDLDQHSELVASANAGILKRFRRFYETRVKAGRVLSDKTRQRIQAVRDSMAQAVSDCEKLLDETKPMADDSEKRAAQTEFLRLEQRAFDLGVPTN